MSREIAVGTDGYAGFPEIGAVPLQGMTVNQLEAFLNKSTHQLAGADRPSTCCSNPPPVTKIYVLGEVGQPGP